MRISVELSMYPLNSDYKPLIINFVKRLRAADGIEVETNGMSSHIFGEYDIVLPVLNAEIKQVFEGEDKVSMVMKILNDDLSGTVKF